MEETLARVFTSVILQDIDLYWIRHKAILILNVIFASLCLALLLPVTVKILRGWIICHSLVAKGAYFW